jgi:hypothetical protein
MDAAYQEARSQSRAPTRHLIPKFVMSHMCNSKSVLYNKVCKFHVSDRGNECRYGSQCHFLHFKHLHREPTPTKQTPKLPVLVGTLLSEVSRLGKLMELVTAKLHLNHGEKKIEDEYTCVEPDTKPNKDASTSHKSKSAAIKAESSSRSAFAASLSSAFASKKAKKKKAQKKNTPKATAKQVTQKAKTVSLEEHHAAALEDVKRRLSDLDSLYDEEQPRSMRETCALLGLGYRSPISDADEPFFDGDEID